MSMAAEPGPSPEMAADPARLIEVEELHKRFGSKVVLDDLSFFVPRGEVFGLVGSNGSGKTTVLRILCTLERPDSGTARVAGVSVSEHPDRVKSLIGYVPDSFGVYPRQTAEEYLRFYAAVHGIARPQRRRIATELLDLVNMADRADDHVEAMSPGHQRRMCLARALVHDPEVLLIDDLSSLDLRAQGDFRDLVKSLQDLGKTVLLCSNHLDQLEELCSWVGILESGSMVKFGPLAEVRSRAGPRRHIRIGLAPGADAAAASSLIERFSGVEAVEVDEDGIEAAVGPGFADHELLTALVGAGIPVRSLTAAEEDLRSAVLRLTGTAPA